MGKKIGLFWLRDDFRTIKNDGLIEATLNHDKVVEKLNMYHLFILLTKKRLIFPITISPCKIFFKEG